MRLKDLKLKILLNLGFGIVLALTIILAGTGYFGLNTISNQIIEILTKDGEIAEHAAKVKANILGLRRYEKDYFINLTSSQKREGYFKKWDNQYKQSLKEINELTKAVFLDKDKKIIASMNSELSEYKNGFENVVVNIKDGKVQTPQSANSAMQKYKKYSSNLEKLAMDFAFEGNKRLERMRKNIITISTQLIFIFSIIGILSIIIGVIISRYISRNTTDRIKAFSDLFKKLAGGDLEGRYNVENINCSQLKKCNQPECPEYGRDNVLCFFTVGSFAPEFGAEIHCPSILKGVYKSCRECYIYNRIAGNELNELGAWFNFFSIKFKDMIKGIQVLSHQIAGRTSQMKESSSTLSQGASEQASTTEEMTSSITELSSQTKQAAENSNKAKGLGLETLKSTNKGATQMKEMVQSMDTINESSQNISKIIKTIDEIAFQTNLLALNAAVEAARAGRHGKGFAVVAEEVNNLSKRSSNAAKETADIIEDSMKSVKDGIKVAHETEKTFQEIYKNIEDVTGLVEEISVSSEHQVKGIEEEEKGIQTIDQVTQQNASIAEENASDSEELSTQAYELDRLVNRFRLSDSATGGNGKRYIEESALHSGKGNGNGNGNGNGKKFIKYESRKNKDVLLRKGKVINPEEVISLAEKKDFETFK